VRCDNARQITQFLADIDPLIEVDSQPAELDLLKLARPHNLTVYDASYLELASRRRLPLCTHDKQLVEAAPKTGVRLWQP
jgi:predicted nucleic acid-binding protein